MKINRRSIAAGLTVGVLAGGAGGAIAATTSGAAMASTSSTPTSMATDGSDGYGYGRGGGGWQNRGTGVGWSGVDGDIGGTRWTSFAQSGRQAAQTYLGLSASQLHSRLQSGKTLAEIASNQGKSVAGLENVIETAVTDSVNTDGALSAGQKSSIIANLTSSVDSVVTGASDGVAGPWHGGPDGPMTSGGW